MDDHETHSDEFTPHDIHFDYHVLSRETGWRKFSFYLYMVIMMAKGGNVMGNFFQMNKEELM